MIKSRERKNSRNQKQEQETTNQPQISKQKHNCLLFCWPSPLLLLSIWLKGGDREGWGRLLLGDFGRWAKSCETFLPQWQTTLTPTKKFTNRKVLLFCNFQQTMRLVRASCGAEEASGRREEGSRDWAMPIRAGSLLSHSEREQCKMKLAQKFCDSQAQQEKEIEREEESVRERGRATSEIISQTRGRLYSWPERCPMLK